MSVVTAGPSDDRPRPADHEAPAGAVAKPRINKVGVTLATMTAMIAMIMSSTMVNVAVPDIMGAFGIGQDQAHWMATGFITAMTVSMLMNGWLVTNFGPRNVFVGALALFCLAGFAGLAAPGYLGVVAARVAQGMCAGLIQPLAMSTMFLAYPPEERGAAMGWFGMGVVLGPTIGPCLGGVIVDSTDWRYVFIGAIPVMVFAAVLGGLYLPGRDPAARKAPFNLISFALVTLAVTTFLNGITEGQREGWETRGTFLLLFCSAASMLAFLIRESLSKAPLIQVRLFASRQYATSALVAFVFGAGMFGSIYLVPIMVQTVQGFTATKAGLMLLPGGMTAMLVFPIAGRFSQRVPPAIPIVAGMCVFAISCWWLAGADMLTGFWTLALMVAFGRIGLGFVIPALNMGAMASVPRELVPFASGTLNFIRMSGAAIGVNTLAIVIDGRVASHGLTLLGTQTAGNPATSDFIAETARRLSAHGLPPDEAAGAAMTYLTRLLNLKANELAYQDGFMWLVAAFLMAGAMTAVLLRRNQPKT